MLEKVQESKRVTHARLLETTVAALEGRRLSVAFPTPTLARQFMTACTSTRCATRCARCWAPTSRWSACPGPAREAPRRRAGARRPGPARVPPPVHEGFAPGDEAAPDDPDAPVERGEDAALRLVERALGGRVLGTIGD